MVLLLRARLRAGAGVWVDGITAAMRRALAVRS